jgi:hypothetical protein
MAATSGFFVNMVVWFMVYPRSESLL